MSPEKHKEYEPFTAGSLSLPAVPPFRGEKNGRKNVGPGLDSGTFPRYINCTMILNTV